jgi:hypothetical protein
MKILAFLLFLLPGVVWASGGHTHDHGDINIDINIEAPEPDSGGTSTVETTGEGSVVVKDSYQSSDERDRNRAVAAALAAGSCQFDYSKGFQGCVGAGYWDDESAVSFQVGKRVDDLLLNGGVSCDTDFNQCGGSGAVNFHF